MGQVVLLKPAAVPSSRAAQPPLVVDLDGTLIRTDSLIESLMVLAKRKPWLLFVLPLVLLRGRAAMKAWLAAHALPDVATLPCDAELIDYLRAEHAAGRRLVLATGADRRVAEAVAARFAFFDSVLASDGHTNLSGERKRARLVAELGEEGFDYVGNSARDLAVWRAARHALLVDVSPRLAAQVKAIRPVERRFGDGRAPLRVVLQELRWSHWLKNLLVAVPLLAAHRLHEPAMAGRALLAFVGFCLVASSIYLINDLIDLTVDRRHPRKRNRPLASGRIPVAEALLLAPLLWLAAAAIAAVLPIGYLVTLGVYVLLMLAYSLRVKDWRFIDALLLGCGYTLRMVAGAKALGITVSAWLLACGVLLFFSLALLKRQAELAVLDAQSGHNGRMRAYRIADASLIALTGGAAGGIAVLMLALYPLLRPQALAQPWAMWALCPLLLLWMRRMWRMAAEGRIHDDPVLFALQDGPSRWAGIASLMLVVMAAGAAA